jgi:hypothetical protein
MDEKNKDTIKNGDQEKEKNSHKEIINSITCKEDLTSFFEGSDHSVNKVYFSEVNKYFCDVFSMKKIKENILNIKTNNFAYV